MSAAHRRPSGFTLIEVLAVVLLTSLVLGLAMDFYTDLSNASNRAAENTRELRRATAILDRVARDLQGAVLVKKPPEEDPLDHPWIFLGESRDSTLGSDHVKFVSWANHPRSREAHESDLAMVAFLTHEADDGTLELLRWTSPRLPEGLDRDFPFLDDPNVTLLADGLDSFGVRFMGEDGGWVDQWDSSTIIESSELPLAVEIAVSIAPGTAGDDDVGFDDPDAEDERIHRRVVALPMRPIDLVALLDPLGAGARGDEATDEEGQGDGEDGQGSEKARSLAQCVANRDAFAGTALGTFFLNHQWDQVDDQLRSSLANIRLPSGGTALDALRPECR